MLLQFSASLKLQKSRYVPKANQKKWLKKYQLEN